MNPHDLDERIKQNQALRDADMHAELEEFRRVCLIKNLLYIHKKLRKGTSREINIKCDSLTWHRNWFVRTWRDILSRRGRADYTALKKEILIKALHARGFHARDSYQGMEVWLPEIPKAIDEPLDRREFAKIAFGVSDEEIDEILKGTAKT